MADELEHWDDDEKKDRGRELFFTDRHVDSTLADALN